MYNCLKLKFIPFQGESIFVAVPLTSLTIPLLLDMNPVDKEKLVHFYPGNVDYIFTSDWEKRASYEKSKRKKPRITTIFKLPGKDEFRKNEIVSELIMKCVPDKVKKSSWLLWRFVRQICFISYITTVLVLDNPAWMRDIAWF